MGGVPPIALTNTVGNPLPPGLTIDSARERVSGTPTTAGQFSLSILAQDAGIPSNVFTTSRTFVLNKPLDLGLGEFVAFPLGKPLTLGTVSTGGTSPRTFTVTSGALPGGVSLATDTGAFEGSAAAAGSGRLRVEGIDVAGSADARDVMGVVCVQSAAGRAEMTLPAGDTACGFYFDAVAGSTVSVAAVAAKKQAKRTLSGAVLRPDGTTAIAGAKIKSASGKWSAAGVVCPSTGRYFVVLQSAGGDAAQMLGSVKITPPKGSKLAGNPLDAGDRVFVEIGALAGAKLTLKAVPAKKTDLLLGVQALIDPNGVYTAPGAAATSVGNGVALSIVLTTPGTWTVVLAAKSGSGAYSYSYKIAQPKGGVFILE